MNLSIKQLRSFLTLAELGSFTRASKKINLSQPALSALISSLEKELGYKLFHRDTRKVELNADGLHFIKIARNILKTYDSSIKELNYRSKGQDGVVTLAVLPSLGVQWLPAILVEFNKAHPNITIEIIDSQWDLCLHAILNNEADLAVTAGTPSLKELKSELLFSDDFYLICHKSHPLAQKNHVELSDLREQPFIAFSKGTSIRLYTDQILEIYDIKYIQEVRQLTTMMGLIDHNHGISITTGLTLFQFKHENIRIIPFKDLSLKRAIYLIHNKERELTAAAKTFYDFIKAQASMTHSQF